MFAAAGPRDILLRMLNNLRRIHAGRGEFSRAIRWIDLSLELAPDGAADHRERGVLWLRLEEFGRALADLERYLALTPGAPDEGPVWDQCALLRKLIAQLN
jgi:regulator of sirC expression with transglutaminase-like and TPR domain